MLLLGGEHRVGDRGELDALLGRQLGDGRSALELGAELIGRDAERRRRRLGTGAATATAVTVAARAVPAATHRSGRLQRLDDLVGLRLSEGAVGDERGERFGEPGRRVGTVGVGRPGGCVAGGVGGDRGRRGVLGSGDPGGSGEGEAGGAAAE